MPETETVVSSVVDNNASNSNVKEIPTTSLVDFDGPNDPENPLNRPQTSKWIIVILLSLTTFAT